MAGFLTAVESIFTTAIGMVATVGGTIMNEPILLTFTAIPLVGLAIGIFKRLLSVN